MPGKRNATDIAAEKPQPFDHQAAIVQPFEAEGSRDAEFQQKIAKALLDVVLETQAWASVCPAREHDKTAELLEKEINFIIETEKAQGRQPLPVASSRVTPTDTPKEQTRAMLLDFINSIRSALATLGVPDEQRL